VERGAPENVSRTEAEMRKVVSQLDDEQRAVLLELADFGTAAFSAGLIVALLESVVKFVT
jgi:hypothetical protein